MLALTRRSPASGPDEGNPLEAEQGYLGPSLPAVEIAAGGGPDRARAIGLSLVYPEDDPNMEREFQDLRRLAGSKVAIVVGGRAAASYRATLDQFGALFITDLTQLQVELARLRASLL